MLSAPLRCLGGLVGFVGFQSLGLSAPSRDLGFIGLRDVRHRERTNLLCHSDVRPSALYIRLRVDNLGCSVVSCGLNPERVHHTAAKDNKRYMKRKDYTGMLLMLQAFQPSLLSSGNGTVVQSQVSRGQQTER